MVAVPLETITVDGLLQEDSWQKAAWSEPFLYLDSTTPADQQTRAKVGCDGRALFLGIEANDPRMDAVRGTQRPRDDEGIWQDDCLEVFLTPRPGGATFYQLVLNVAGARWDARYGMPELASAWNPDPDWQVAVTRRADHWTAEAAIPLKALGADEALRGELWGLKLCRTTYGRGGNRNEDAFTTWSYIPSGSYHDPAGWGWLYLLSGNALTNPEFTAGIHVGTALPVSWQQQLVWQEGQQPAGSVQQEERDGRQLLHVTKLPSARGGVLPRASTTALVRGGCRFCGRMDLQGQGGVVLTLLYYTPAGGSGHVAATAELRGTGWETVTVEGDVPADAHAAGLMVSYDREPVGDLWIGRASLTDLGRPLRHVEVDVNHGLEAAAAEMHDMKPYALLRDEQGRYPYERLIFTDAGTGTEIWRITNDYSTANCVYSNMYPWNPAGTTLKLISWERPGGPFFLVDADGAALQALPDLGAAQEPRWSRDPDWIDYGTFDALMRYNWRTGEREEVCRIPAEIKQGGRSTFTWNMDLPGLVYYEQAFGTGAPLYFVDLRTRRVTRIPITSDSQGDKEKDWLYSAGLTRIADEWYVQYSINHLPYLSDQNPYQQRLGSIDGKRGLNRLSLDRPDDKPPQPLYSHGGTQPSRHYETGFYSGGICLWDFARWEGKMLVTGPPDGHISWEYLDDSFLAGVTGRPGSGPFASQILKVHTDGTWYTVAHGNTVASAYETNLFVNLSPDGTKGSFTSTMLGPANLYWCVVSYPEPPRDLAAATNGRQVSLTWQQPGRCAELAGYHVYRSSRSGVDYQRLTDQPVTTESYQDTAPDPAQPSYYVVTAVEHSGLESRCPSGEAVGGTLDPQAAERLFLEVERCRLEAPLRENLHGSASNLRFVDYRDGEGDGRLTAAFPTRKPGPHVLWARMRYQGAGTPATPWEVTCGGAPLGALVTGSREWEWRRLEQPVPARAGGTEVLATVSGSGLAVDKLVLTDDPDWQPSGEEKLDSNPPPTPAGLRAEQTRSFDVTLAWEAVPGDCRAYQVYRGTQPDFAPSQATLVGSPAGPGFVNWGLQAGTTYFLRVCSLDRFGNESAPSPALQVQTVPLPQPVGITVEAETGQSTGNCILVDETGASGGRYAKLAAQTEGETLVFPTLDLSFTVPVAGEYIIWMKLCQVSDLGYAYLSAQVDDGPPCTALCYFPESRGGRSFKDTCRWRYVNQFQQELPMIFRLEAGPHKLTMGGHPHKQDYGLDQVVISNDLGKRPPGRHMMWDKDGGAS
jgi:hypothetical protein